MVPCFLKRGLPPATPGNDNHGVFPRCLRELRPPRGHGRPAARHESRAVCIRRVSSSLCTLVYVDLDEKREAIEN